jgi:hypothetical protein
LSRYEVLDPEDMSDPTTLDGLAELPSFVVQAKELLGRSHHSAPHSMAPGYYNCVLLSYQQELLTSVLHMGFGDGSKGLVAHTISTHAAGPLYNMPEPVTGTFRHLDLFGGLSAFRPGLYNHKYTMSIISVLCTHTITTLSVL